jgi:hypothetical protein
MFQHRLLRCAPRAGRALLSSVARSTPHTHTLTLTRLGSRAHTTPALWARGKALQHPALGPSFSSFSNYEPSKGKGAKKSASSSRQGAASENNPDDEESTPASGKGGRADRGEEERPRTMQEQLQQLKDDIEASLNEDDGRELCTNTH